MKLRGLYAVTPDLADTADLLRRVEQALLGGVRLVQYRNKTAATALRHAQAAALLRLCHVHEARLIVNDDLSLALDIGAGNGLHSRFLAPHFGTLASVDLSMEMLRRAPAGPASRVCGDASRLPVADGSIDALVLCNCFLFPAEVARVLSPSGVLAWINSRGTGTPIHLPADEVDAALPGAWEGVASTAGWGTWSVHWRQSPYS